LDFQSSQFPSFSQPQILMYVCPPCLLHNPPIKLHLP
jgi:hypothetical protein